MAIYATAKQPEGEYEKAVERFLMNIRKQQELPRLPSVTWCEEINSKLDELGPNSSGPGPILKDEEAVKLPFAMAVHEKARAVLAARGMTETPEALRKEKMFLVLNAATLKRYTI
jgi:hypothetical protein